MDYDTLVVRATGPATSVTTAQELYDIPTMKFAVVAIGGHWSPLAENKKFLLKKIWKRVKVCVVATNMQAHTTSHTYTRTHTYAHIYTYIHSHTRAHTHSNTIHTHTYTRTYISFTQKRTYTHTLIRVI